jgi:site-specific DNA-cytosine methylase
VAAAYDISPAANATYALNHGDRPRERELAAVPMEQIGAVGADTWVLSPPCQPFCRMGRRMDLEDPRSRAYLRVLELIEGLRPRRLALENVEGFLGSEAHARLSRLLEGLGYGVQTFRLCPTAFGIPNQRPRVYLAAARGFLPRMDLSERACAPLRDYLDPAEDPGLYLPEAVLAKHWKGLDLVRAEDRRSACFIGGYGRRYVGGGSFLVTERGVRRFSPAEVARLMGLPTSFRFPEALGLEQRYKLLGNGLSIPVAAWVLKHLA